MLFNFILITLCILFVFFVLISLTNEALKECNRFCVFLKDNFLKELHDLDKSGAIVAAMFCSLVGGIVLYGFLSILFSGGNECETSKKEESHISISENETLIQLLTVNDYIYYAGDIRIITYADEKIISTRNCNPIFKSAVDIKPSSDKIEIPSMAFVRYKLREYQEIHDEIGKYC